MIAILQASGSISRRLRRLVDVLVFTLPLALAGMISPLTQAQTNPTYTVIYTFTQSANDGAFPFAGLIRDAAGNLYGSTSGGGDVGYGTVFKIDATGTLTVLHSFNTEEFGAVPFAALIEDTTGNLYGTGFYRGDVFKVDPAGNETVLYFFSGGTDGGWPYGGLVADASGNLYGTTIYGGLVSCGSGELGGCGVIFKVDTSGTESVLYSFTRPPDGTHPLATLLRDPAGNLYGTAGLGGAANSWSSIQA